MKLAILTVAIASLGSLLGMTGCGRTDASAAEGPGPGGAPAGPKEDKPAAPTAKGEEWTAEAKLIKPSGTEKLYTLDITLVAAKSWHVNTEYPFRFKAGGFDVEFKQAEFKKDDPAFVLDKCVDTPKGKECSELHLKATFSAGDLKKAKAGGELRFGVCSADKCKIDKAHLAVEVQNAKTA